MSRSAVIALVIWVALVAGLVVVVVLHEPWLRAASRGATIAVLAATLPSRPPDRAPCHSRHRFGTLEAA